MPKRGRLMVAETIGSHMISKMKIKVVPVGNTKAAVKAIETGEVGVEALGEVVEKYKLRMELEADLVDIQKIADFVRECGKNAKK